MDHSAQYNCSKSGWFDDYYLNDWFRTVIMPWALRKEGHKVALGDNLSTHFDRDILKLSEDHETSFVSPVTKSTLISQLLDIVFYGPLKKKRRKILKDWKINNHTQTTLPKDIFPALLKQLVSVLDSDNLKSGFRRWGINPFNPDVLHSKLPENVDSATENEHKIPDSIYEYQKEMPGEQVRN